MLQVELLLSCTVRGAELDFASENSTSHGLDERVHEKAVDASEPIVADPVV